MSFMLEVCADSVQSAINAQKGGADRIELCSALVIGGLSPSPAVFRQVRHYTDLPVRVLLRPRFGDFCYDDHEFAVLREEVELFRELGADGVVIGILKPDGSLDEARMRVLVDNAGQMQVTLHRAFDVCKDPYETLERCVALGVDTILTSGQKSCAWQGKMLLSELVERAAGRIDILAGAGVAPDNIRDIALYTGVTSFHMSGKKVLQSSMDFRREGVPMGIPGFSEYEIWQTDVEQVRKASDVIGKLNMT